MQWRGEVGMEPTEGAFELTKRNEVGSTDFTDIALGNFIPHYSGREFRKR